MHFIEDNRESSESKHLCIKDDQKISEIIKEQSTSAKYNHEELVNLTKEAIEQIIKNDSLFSGLPTDATIEEIKAQCAVAHGQAITLYLDRGDLSTIPIVVPSYNTTVGALKKAITRDTNLHLKRENTQQKISWKHVWKKYDLCFENTKLSNNGENIKAYGISNKSTLKYAKKKREKNKLINKSMIY